MGNKLPVSLISPAGASTDDVIGFDGTDVKFVTAPKSIVTSVTSDFTVTQTPKDGDWSIDSSITRIIGGHGNIIKLDTNRVIVMVRNSTWSVYDYDNVNSTWSQVGNSFNPGWGNVELQGAATLTPTRFVVGNSSTGLIYAFDFDGTNITQVGNTISVSAPNNNITELNSTDFTVLVGSSLRTYRFDGTNFSLVGNALTTSLINYIEHIGGNRVVGIDVSTSTMYVYEFDGTDWSSLGNSFTTTLSLSGPTSVCAMDKTNNAHTFAVVNSPDSVNTNISYHVFDGTDGTQDGNNFSSSIGSGDTRGCGLSDSVILVASSAELVYAYKTDITDFNTVIADDNTKGLLGNIVYNGALFDLTGTAVDGTYTVQKTITDDSIQIIESISPQSFSGKIELQVQDGDSVVVKDGSFVTSNMLGKLELISSAVASGDISVDFVDGFTDDYCKWIIIGEQIEHSASAHLYLRVSTDGGDTFITTSDYDWLGTDYGSANTLSRELGVSYIQLTPRVPLGSGNSNLAYTEVELSGLTNNGERKPILFRTMDTRNANPIHYIGGGQNDTTLPINGLRLTPASGTITGNFYLYGLRK